MNPLQYEQYVAGLFQYREFSKKAMWTLLDDQGELKLIAGLNSDCKRHVFARFTNNDMDKGLMPRRWAILGADLKRFYGENNPCRKALKPSQAQNPKS